MAYSDLIALRGFADPFSSLSHLAAAAACAGLAGPLARRGRRAGGRAGGRVVSLVVFAASAVVLLSMSGVYHLLGRETAARPVFQRLDHAAIFVLIAGTFTPVHAILFRGAWRWGMLAFIWTVAALGVALKSVYFASTPEALGIALYLGMGWIGAVSMVKLGRGRGARFVLPLALGGIVYSAGAAVEWAEPRPIIPGVIRAHELFHLLVMLGLALHWGFIWKIAALGPRGAEGERRGGEAGASVSAEGAGEHRSAPVRKPGVHFIIFEATSEERSRPGAGLDLCGDRDLEGVSTGDTVWVVTRLSGDRPMPGLCGRLHAAGITPHISKDSGFDPSHDDCRFRLLVDEDRSERCVPFACEMIVSWNIWRQPFRGVRPLSEEQGQTLDAEWVRSGRQRR